MLRSLSQERRQGQRQGQKTMILLLLRKTNHAALATPTLIEFADVVYANDNMQFPN